MIGPVLIFLAFGLYAALHSILASPGLKRRVFSALGSAGERSYRLAYNMIGGLTFIPVLAVLARFPGESLYRISGAWLLVSSLLQLGGAAIILAGMLQTDIWHFLGLRQLLETRAEIEELTISGLYRHVRHPLYSGGLLLIWFSPLMTTGLLSFNLAATLYLYVGSIFEERRLVDQFGEAYQDYQSRVPRLIPGLRITRR